MKTPIPVFAVNLACRTERRRSIEEQFAGRPEFRLTVVPGIELPNGPWALWQTFYGIVQRAARADLPFFIFCEDDHVFTPDYSPQFLFDRIAEADALRADILSGGMAVTRCPVQVSDHLFWVAGFNGMQFTVVFRRCYARILASKTDEGYVTDIHLGSLSHSLFVTHPHISEQREFGYSDATTINNEDGRVEGFFRRARNLLQKLSQIRTFYAATSAATIEAIRQTDVSGMFLPAYVVNLPERTDRRAHILRQFEGRNEFDLHIVEACRHEYGAVGLWQSICKIVGQAERDGEDAVLIVEDDHVFTPAYDRDRFLRQVLLAGSMGAELLSGGIGGFRNLVPLPGGLFWDDWFWCTQFIVVYRKAFRTILDARFSVRDVADEKLSSLLTAKMVTVPFVSRQADFGYSDVTEGNNTQARILRHFEESTHRAAHYLYAIGRYLSGRPIREEPADRLTPYLSQPGPHALQLGCGHHLLPGWLNTDVEPTYGAAFLDATQRFPLPDGSFRYVFFEHLIEFLPYRLGRKLLGECFRVLRPGGVLRLTVCSVERLVQLYTHPDDESVRRYARWNAGYYSPKTAQALAGADGCPPPALVLNNFMRQAEKEVLYDFALLRDQLTAAGFRAVTLCPVGESRHPTLRGVEHRPPYVAPEALSFENISIEAEKPL